MNSISQVKQLREETGVSITECQKALKEAEGDLEKAKEILKQWGRTLAQKKSGRETKEGIVDSYIHPNKKIGVILELLCESDFVAHCEEFQKLAHELCLQIAAVDPQETPLPKQLWIKDGTKTVKDLIGEYVAKLGEKIEVKKFTRYSI